jgi:hypothetical protein
MARKRGEKMAVRRGNSPLEAVLSLKDEAFLKNLTSFPPLFEIKEVKERLERINGEWKRKIEVEKTREGFREHVLYLVHLCPRLLEISEFAWLKEKFYGILTMRLWDSEADKGYWEALNRVKKAFTPTKPKTPEKKQRIARKFEYYRYQWIKEKIYETCKDLLENYVERDEDFERNRFLKKIKTSQNVVDHELERLNRIHKEEIKDKDDFLRLPIILQNELMMTADEKEKEEGLKFWGKIWKPIFRDADQLKTTFIRKVANETGIARETVRKAVKQAYKDILSFNQ